MVQRDANGDELVQTGWENSKKKLADSGKELKSNLSKIKKRFEHDQERSLKRAAFAAVRFARISESNFAREALYG